MFRFHHVSLSVSDLEASRQFYNSLNFQTVFEWKAEDDSLAITHMKLGDSFLELFCYENSNQAAEYTKDLKTDLPTLGVKHFALEVDDIQEARKKLRKNGFNKMTEISEGRTGITYFFVQDPDGMFVEIVCDDRGL